MHVEITIVAKDYEAGKKVTRTEEVEISPRTLKLFEMFTNGESEGTLRWVADTIFGTALREAQGGGKSADVSSAMAQTGGGRVGGRSAPGANKQVDSISEALGLDIIRAANAKNRAPQAPPQQQQPQQPAQAGPGPVGFGDERPQLSQPGPGPVGFANEKPINPGPGPGHIGFGPDRNI